MEDIARLAGVSKAAVSLAFNGKPGVGQETRERILRMAKQHGYVPKIRNKTRDSALKTLTFLIVAHSDIVPEQYARQSFFRELIQHLEERCRANGYVLLFRSVDAVEAEDDGLSFLEEIRGDGAILLGTNLSRSLIERLSHRLACRLVVLDTCYDTLPLHFVEINNRMGAYQAGMHLCGLGHRTIGYIASDERIHNFEARRSGFNAALREYGLTIADAHVFTISPAVLSSQACLKEQLTACMRDGQSLPTAFFCECDYMAISAMKTLSELGYRIPDDVSVVGFDNILESTVITPELTTIHVDKERMAHMAVDLIVGPDGTESRNKTKIAIDTHLVARQSTRSVDRGIGNDRNAAQP